MNNIEAITETVPHSEYLSHLTERAKEARKLIIDMAASETGCHIGGSLSVIDLLVAVYSKYENDENTAIVLSKGHTAAALYATLYLYGLIKENPAESYGQAGSLFTGHPNHKLPHIPFATGSLGHGVPYAAGWALAQKIQSLNGLGIALGGDGELQEGLIWETVQIIQAKYICNFIYIVDCNGGQNDGYISDISPIPNLRQRFEAFGFQVAEIDGHNMAEIKAALELNHEKPLAILAKTIKGKGVEAIEGNPDAHYAKISERIASKWKRSLG